jgi:predicted membrane channel-forming protein YqfA (hemolysin III family)
MDRHHHTLNAACNLLGICFVIITGLKISNYSGRTVGDEAAWVAAVFFLVSIFTAFWHIRSEMAARWQGVVSDYAFIAGVVMLATATVIVGFELRRF